VRLSRRRGDELREAIFDAVFAQLREHGYGGLTMGSVATAAGTGKAALYRRWCTKQELVADAVRSGLPSPRDAPRHATVRDDLVELLRALRDALATTGGAPLHAGVEDGMVRDAFAERVVVPVQELILEAFLRGAERGEVHPDAADPQLATVGPAMIIHRMLTEGRALSDRDLAELVDGVLVRMLAGPRGWPV
jgi:AcrR family transcriptional regulator